MVKVTILGAGITGMMAAATLPRDYDITIVAEYLPGDYHTKEWASPYAGVIWVGVHNSRPGAQEMQLQGLRGLLRLAETNPESSVRQIHMTEIMDRGSKDHVWYAGKVPEFKFMDQSEIPPNALYGMTYKTVVLAPTKFLDWMYQRLLIRGVKFRRTHVASLGTLKGLGHDVLINAAGVGAQKLTDVMEANLIPWRLQTVVAKAPPGYDRLFIRRGDLGYYSTAFSRMDGTVYIGGALTSNDLNLSISEESRIKICKNAHLNQPNVFPSPDPKHFDILYDHLGIYATMDNKVGSVRCEREIVDGQRVVHAYGQNAGGYVYSFGLAREVVRLTQAHLDEIPFDSKL